MVIRGVQTLPEIPQQTIDDIISEGRIDRIFPESIESGDFVFTRQIITDYSAYQFLQVGKRHFVRNGLFKLLEVETYEELTLPIAPIGTIFRHGDNSFIRGFKPRFVNENDSGPAIYDFQTHGTIRLKESIVDNYTEYGRNLLAIANHRAIDVLTGKYFGPRHPDLIINGLPIVVIDNEPVILAHSCKERGIVSAINLRTGKVVHDFEAKEGDSFLHMDGKYLVYDGKNKASDFFSGEVLFETPMALYFPRMQVIDGRKIVSNQIYPSDPYALPRYTHFYELSDGNLHLLREFPEQVLERVYRVGKQSYVLAADFKILYNIQTGEKRELPLAVFDIKDLSTTSTMVIARVPGISHSKRCLYQVELKFIS